MCRRPGAELAYDLVEFIVVDVDVSARGEIRPTRVGGSAQGSDPGRILCLLSLEKTESFAQHLTGILVAPGRHQRLDEFVLVLSQNYVSSRTATTSFGAICQSCTREQSFELPNHHLPSRVALQAVAHRGTWRAGCGARTIRAH